MKLKLTYYGNPILRKNCAPVEAVTDEIRELANEMLKAMEIENGIGLAAPQVGIDMRLFVTCTPVLQEDDEWAPGTPRVFINPRIVSISEETDLREEGCLSLPGVYGMIERPIQVTVESTDLDGKTVNATYEGLEARCILHENDHINGKLFIDRMDKKARKLLDKELRALKKKYT